MYGHHELKVSVSRVCRALIQQDLPYHLLNDCVESTMKSLHRIFVRSARTDASGIRPRPETHAISAPGRAQQFFHSSTSVPDYLTPTPERFIAIT